MTNLDRSNLPSSRAANGGRLVRPVRRLVAQSALEEARLLASLSAVDLASSSFAAPEDALSGSDEFSEVKCSGNFGVPFLRRCLLFALPALLLLRSRRIFVFPVSETITKVVSSMTTLRQHGAGRNVSS